jgi:hypothetical protein
MPGTRPSGNWCSATRSSTRHLRSSRRRSNARVLFCPIGPMVPMVPMVLGLHRPEPRSDLGRNGRLCNTAAAHA